VFVGTTMAADAGGNNTKNWKAMLFYNTSVILWWRLETIRKI